MTVEPLGLRAVEEQLRASAAACRNAAEAHVFADGGRRDASGLVPADPESWLEILRGYPESRASAARLRAIKAAHPGGAVEHYGLLRAFSLSAGRIARAPVAGSVKRLYARLCLDVASPSPRWLRQFDASDPRFMEMAKLAALQRFPAGEVVFNVIRMPRSWPLKIHPLALPGFVRELAFGMGGLGPVISPHFNSWRPNPIIMQRDEMLRSLWRIAKTMEIDRSLKGLMGDGWFFSAETGELSPHLSWMREISAGAGAYLVDMEAASADSGFMTGSAGRELHRQGKFHPRRTLVLWRRNDILSWAACNPQWGDKGEAPPKAPRASSRFRSRSPAPVRRRGENNSVLTLWRGVGMLNHKPRAYIALMLVFPALTLAAAAGAFGGLWAAPAFAASFAAAWVFQYFFFQ